MTDKTVKKWRRCEALRPKGLIAHGITCQYMNKDICLGKQAFHKNPFLMCSHLYVPWKLHIRNDDKIKYLIKTSEVIVINRVMITNMNEENI